MINIKTICSSLDTENIQWAIDNAAKDKMTVFFPQGEYKVTTLKLRDNTSIYLDESAVIAAADENEWSNVGRMPVLFSENTKNIRIEGKGSISANGYAFSDENGYKKDIKGRPDNIMRFRNVKGIVIMGIILTDTVGWTIHLDNCEDALIDGISIKNPPYTVRKNSDVIDINGCRNITVKNCF
ncbi:MAG: hypothetical protein IJH94_04180, partial [Clostridia bacterium]|nr:hypothetical protein [Clostridia bacterium]